MISHELQLFVDLVILFYSMTLKKLNLHFARKGSDKGFTLAELLIVITIIAVIVAVVILNMMGERARANDARRKSDLYRLRTVFEEYNNDHQAYPPNGTTSNCKIASGQGNLPPNKETMASYITSVPCDPNGGAYGYFKYPAEQGAYRICTTLEDTKDPAIAAAGCGGVDKCGLGRIYTYNYCLSSGLPPSGSSSEFTTIGEYHGPGNNACNSVGTCKRYDYPVCKGCPKTFSTGDCDGYCSDSVYWCTDVTVPNCP